MRRTDDERFERPIAEAFELVVELAVMMGATVPLNQHEGCWAGDVDGDWRVALNPHGVPNPDKGCDVPPYCVLVWWGEFPAGIFSAHDGTICAGEMANEDTLCAALRKKLDELNQEAAAPHGDLED